MESRRSRNMLDKSTAGVTSGTGGPDPIVLINTCPDNAGRIVRRNLPLGILMMTLSANAGSPFTVNNFGIACSPGMGPTGTVAVLALNVGQWIKGRIVGDKTIPSCPARW